MLHPTVVVEVAEEVLTDDLLRQVVHSPIQSQELPLLRTNVVSNSLLLDQGMNGVLCVPWFVDKFQTKGSRSYLGVCRLGCGSRLVE